MKGIDNMASAIAEVAGGLVNSALQIAGVNRQEKYQTRMANTAHQREVRDLRAAGLNPILSAMGGNGASSPVGALYTPDNPAKGLSANIQQTLLNKHMMSKIDEETKTQLTQQQLNSAAAQREIANANLSIKQLEAVNAAVQRDMSAAAVNSATAKNLGYDAEAKRLEAEIYNTPYVGKGLRIIEKLNPIGGGLLNKLFGKKKNNTPYIPDRRW